MHIRPHVTEGLTFCCEKSEQTVFHFEPRISIISTMTLFTLQVSPDSNVPTSPSEVDCIAMQTGSLLMALVKLESSALNQVVLTVRLLCHSCWQEISVNSTPLGGHAPSLPIDSGLQSYGHKVTKTGFAHQYLT